jgi:hypothetical protein
MRSAVPLALVVLLAVFLAAPVPLSAAGSGAGSSAGISLGDKPPEASTKLPSNDGRELTLAGIAGPNGTLVFFTCNHCPWAKAWEARLVALGNQALKQGFGVIAINPNDDQTYPEDAPGPMRDRARAAGMSFPYAVDPGSKVARAFGATKTPEAYLFDKSGKLVYHGAIDDNAHEPERVTRRFLASAIEAVLAGKPVAEPETKALGCGIKFKG